MPAHPREPPRHVLEAAHCWEADDRVPGRPATTAFRRAARLQQARWREAEGHPAGTQPIRPRPQDARVRTVGSRLPLDHAEATGANFVTDAAWAAAHHRSTTAEPHQSFDHQRFWADLLSSQALAVNLFGEVTVDPEAARDVVRALCPDAPGRVREVRFAHSPGRFDPDYLNSLRDFSAAFLLELDGGGRGIVAIGTLFHERLKAETPKPANRPWYEGVAERSGAFRPGAIEVLLGRTELCVVWLEHLLALSMLQHPAGEWRWARYVVVHPGTNPDACALVDEYRRQLADATTFGSTTIESLLASGALPPATTAAVRARYLDA